MESNDKKYKVGGFDSQEHLAKFVDGYEVVNDSYKYTCKHCGRLYLDKVHPSVNYESCCRQCYYGTTNRVSTIFLNPLKGTGDEYEEHDSNRV